MTLLNSPKNFAELTRLGPVYNDAIKMQEFLKDEKRFGVVYCTLPEEMPLQETKEFCDRFSDKYTAPLVAINKIFPNSAGKCQTPPDHPTNAICRYIDNRLTRENNALEKYKKGFRDDDLLQLPFCFSETETLKDTPAVQLADDIVGRFGGLS